MFHRAVAGNGIRFHVRHVDRDDGRHDDAVEASICFYRLLERSFVRMKAVPRPQKLMAAFLAAFFFQLVPDTYWGRFTSDPIRYMSALGQERTT